MAFAINQRRFLFIGAMLFLAIVTGGLLARITLTEMAVSALLRMAGASDVTFSVAQASPWHVVFEDIDFQLKTQPLAAKRLSVTRKHWWTPSLGAVRIEEVRMPVTIDGSDFEPAAYRNAAVVQNPAHVPMEEVHVDGRLIIRAAAVPDQALALNLDARLAAKDLWAGTMRIDGPGLKLDGDLGYNLANETLNFKLPRIALDLKTWQDFVQQIVVLPGGTWRMEGKFTGNAEGSFAGGKLSASGAVHLRDGRVRYESRDVTAEGVEADLEFTDFESMQTKPGSVRVHELRVGAFPMRELDARLSLAGSEKIAVSSLSLLALGGRASTEPFNYFPTLREIDAVVLVDGISVEEIMGLTKDLPARATGRVSGRFPIRVDDSGLRFGTGWLALTPGVYAELQLEAGGLLTNGVAAGSPSYSILKRIEAGLLKLRISELRLDIRPPAAPPGRSAQLHIAGSPVDPTVKAPVVLDLNVNGPLEKLLNLGMDSRVSFK